jgi:hypothetical protein
MRSRDEHVWSRRSGVVARWAVAVWVGLAVGCLASGCDFKETFGSGGGGGGVGSGDSTLLPVLTAADVYEGGGGGVGSGDSTHEACTHYITALDACYTDVGADLTDSGIDTATFCDAYTVDVPEAADYFNCLGDYYNGIDCTDEAGLGTPDCTY